MSAPGAILRECPVAQLGRNEPDQTANANVRHLIALDTCVDPGTRHLQEARSFTCIPQSVPELLCCVHGAEEYSWCESRVNTEMSHFCIETYFSRRRLTTYSRKSFALRLFRSRSKVSIIDAGSRYQERASSMRSFTTSLSDCRPVSFIRWSSQVRISRGTRTLMLDNSIVRGVRAMPVSISNMSHTCYN